MPTEYVSAGYIVVFFSLFFGESWLRVSARHTRHWSTKLLIGFSRLLTIVLTAPPVLYFSHPPPAPPSSSTGQISSRKTVGRVVIHDANANTQYLCTSDSGVAHVLDMDVRGCRDWCKDSPYTWAEPKSSDRTIVDIGGQRVPYLVRKRSCHPPKVCSLMPQAVAELTHEEVNFEHPTWVSAMNLCEDNDSPERRVHNTTLVRFFSFSA